MSKSDSKTFLLYFALVFWDTFVNLINSMGTIIRKTCIFTHNVVNTVLKYLTRPKILSLTTLALLAPHLKHMFNPSYYKESNMTSFYRADLKAKFGDKLNGYTLLPTNYCTLKIAFYKVFESTKRRENML